MLVFFLDFTSWIPQYEKYEVINFWAYQNHSPSKSIQSSLLWLFLRQKCPLGLTRRLGSHSGVNSRSLWDLILLLCWIPVAGPQTATSCPSLVLSMAVGFEGSCLLFPRGPGACPEFTALLLRGPSFFLPFNQSFPFHPRLLLSWQPMTKSSFSPV